MDTTDTATPSVAQLFLNQLAAMRYDQPATELEKEALRRIAWSLGLDYYLASQNITMANNLGRMLFTIINRL